MYCKNVSHQYYATNQDTKPHILSWNCPKIGLDQCLSFFICHSFFYYAAFFPLKGKLKYIIIHFPYEISNDIIFPNLMPTETLAFSLYLSKFANSFFTCINGRHFCDHKLFRNKLLWNLYLWFWPEIAKMWSFKYSFG